jgi:hypothetical protein
MITNQVVMFTVHGSRLTVDCLEAWNREPITVNRERLQTYKITFLLLTFFMRGI